MPRDSVFKFFGWCAVAAIVAGIFLLLYSALAVAAEAVGVVQPEAYSWCIGSTEAACQGMVLTPDFLGYLLQSFNGLKGASVFGAAAILVQLIVKALDQPFASRFFGNSSGLNKLLIVAGLTFALTPIGLVTGAGLPIGVALVHSSTLTALMVFLNQVYKQASAAQAAKLEASKKPDVGTST